MAKFEDDKEKWDEERKYFGLHRVYAYELDNVSEVDQAIETLKNADAELYKYFVNLQKTKNIYQIKFIFALVNTYLEEFLYTRSIYKRIKVGGY